MKKLRCKRFFRAPVRRPQSEESHKAPHAIVLKQRGSVLGIRAALSFNAQP